MTIIDKLQAIGRAARNREIDHRELNPFRNRDIDTDAVCQLLKQLLKDKATLALELLSDDEITRERAKLALELKEINSV